MLQVIYTTQHLPIQYKQLKKQIWKVLYLHARKYSRNIGACWVERKNGEKIHNNTIFQLTSSTSISTFMKTTSSNSIFKSWNMKRQIILKTYSKCEHITQKNSKNWDSLVLELHRHVWQNWTIWLLPLFNCATKNYSEKNVHHILKSICLTGVLTSPQCNLWTLDFQLLYKMHYASKHFLEYSLCACGVCDANCHET